MFAGVFMVACGWFALFVSFRDEQAARDELQRNRTRWRVAGAVLFVLGTIVFVVAADT